MEEVIDLTIQEKKNWIILLERLNSRMMDSLKKSINGYHHLNE